MTRFRVVVFILTLASVLALPLAAHATPTFLSAINLSDPGQDGFEPQVAVDGSGNVIAVWTRSDGTNLRIQSADRTPSGPWSTPQTLSDPLQDASQPQVAVDPSGDALVVWTRFDGTNLRIQADYRPAGGSFGTPVTVSDPGQPASGPSVAMDNNGKGVIVWSREDAVAPTGKLRVQSVVRDPGVGGGFSAVQTLSLSGQDAFDAKVAAGPAVDNNAVVVWTRSDGTNLRVQSSRRRDPGGYPRPKGATPMRVALVVAYNQCTGVGNRQHGVPLNSPSCNPPVQSSSILTVGTQEANGLTPGFQGSVRMLAVVGGTNPDINDSDVKLITSMTDIRNNPSLTDYTGKLLVSMPLQITDQSNSTTGENPDNGTTTQFNLEYPIQCVATTDTTIGGACSLTTTENALLPGAVIKNRRAIWQTGQIVVKDAGPNGTGLDTPPCPPTCGDGDESVFAREGVWVP